jgi:hypothetical protein
MLGQEAHGWKAYAQNTVQTWEMTVQVNGRDTFAEAAITAFGTRGESPTGYFGITRVVSESGTETFVPAGSFGLPNYRQAIFRRKVTSIRLQLACWDSYVRGRVLLNFWS